jgi:chemotaxis protein methyltransferase CheR
VTAAPDHGLSLVAEHLARNGGPPLAAYKDRCLRRRLAVRMRACGVASLTEYAAILADSALETDRLLEALTINVTEFFRNPEVWERLAEVLQPVLTRRGGHLRAWSAGCASGEEPYSLALLLASLPGFRSGAATIDATDIDLACLARARAGRYPALVQRAHPLCARLPREDDEVVMPADLRLGIRFAHHDLLRDPPPAPPYDLILCRNVIIYFERQAQDRLFEVFISALAPDGLLVLGRVETVLGAARERVELLHNRERIYRRRS